MIPDGYYWELFLYACWMCKFNISNGVASMDSKCPNLLKSISRWASKWSVNIHNPALKCPSNVAFTTSFNCFVRVPKSVKRGALLPHRHYNLSNNVSNLDTWNALFNWCLLSKISNNTSPLSRPAKNYRFNFAFTITLSKRWKPCLHESGFLQFRT